MPYYESVFVARPDISAAQVEALSERYFGWIPAAAEVPAAKPTPSPDAGEHTLTLTERKGPAPVIALIYRPDPAGHKDENALEMLVALSPDDALDLSLLDDAAAAPRETSGSLRDRVDGFERALIVDALDAAGGNKAEAARALGIGRVTLYEKLHKYGL